MKNFIEVGDVITVPAPTGGVLSGGVVIIGSLLGIAETTAAAGVPVAASIGGVHELPKVSTQAWAIGQPVYWDPIALNTTTVTTSNTLIGYATEPAANPSSVGRVRLYEHV